MFISYTQCFVLHIVHSSVRLQYQDINIYFFIQVAAGVHGGEAGEDPQQTGEPNKLPQNITKPREPYKFP